MCRSLIPFGLTLRTVGNAGQRLKAFSLVTTFCQKVVAQNQRLFTSSAMTAVSQEPVEVNGRQYRAVVEGLASILAPYREKNESKTDTANRADAKPKNNDEGDQAVFYNPIQQYNRDLSVLAILTYGEGAVLEKQSKFQQRTKQRNKKRKRVNGETPSNTTDLPSSEASVRKRTADGTELSHLRLETKKPRLDEPEWNEDLPAKKLNGDETSTDISQQGEIHGNSSLNGEDGPPGSSTRRVPFTILDALSASGLRAIRYAKEIPFATNIIANDVSQEAVRSIELNVDHNSLRGKIHSNVGDARAYMYSKVGNESQTGSPGYVHRFDVIDLDPYGTAAPFFDSALQALADGGLLCVTCTDAGVWASNGYPEKAYALYSGIPLKGAFSHEAGLRLILHAIATSAAKYGIAIEPLLSLSIDFYGRVFVRIHKSQQEVKMVAGTSMLVYNCDAGCGAWQTQLLARNQEKQAKNGDKFYKYSFAQAPSTDRLCEHCGTKMHLGGPMWAGPLHNPYFVQRMLHNLDQFDKTVYGTADRVRGMLTLALEEDLTLAASNGDLSSSESNTEHTNRQSNAAQTSINDNSTTTEITPTSTVDPKLIPRVPSTAIDQTPFFFIPNYLAKILHCTTPPEAPLRGAIRRLGYRVTRSHCKAGSFKTDAPFSVLWEIFREWLRQREPEKIAKLLGEGEYEGKGTMTRGTPGWRILGKLRGHERERGSKVAEELSQKLNSSSHFNGDREELKSMLKAALWELDHHPIEDSRARITTSITTAEKTANNDSNEGRGENTDDQHLRQKALPASVGSDRAAPVSLAPKTEDCSRLDIIFDEQLGKEKARSRLVRYQINPRANWGPMNRAGGF